MLSLCTLGRGRADHLVNLVHGLNRQATPPAELVIGVMQETPYTLPATAFPARQIMMASDTLPLAAARNAAARTATGDRIAFLDIDCIPDPDFVGDHAARLGDQDALVMGEMLYLPAGATDDGIDYARFDRIAELHSERAGPPEGLLGPCRDYRCFWSLNFSMRRDRFLALGGFDESFVGYGGEDTDFGRSVATAGVPIFWARGARAYHQYHPHHMPPVHHVESVVANARRFHDKWGEWTMQHWLRAFVLMGLIARRGDDYVMLRAPDERDFALTRQQADRPYASSARVLSMLEAGTPATASA
ncbi:galactosyltransferase-related protein [Sphingomonas sp. S1-29]|uniref:galactosyltransferase-related protein n=1 Tax=Sphingomonas sp. S1-29 TaxID=2991074 RepID=UPI00223ECB21|nr:galactosyltransferase-related protein [Sphingomonas sp. S1-29]UZK68960.1 galactosyltransferase-related protein [Sphingomonas sp. S1-29]